MKLHAERVGLRLGVADKLNCICLFFFLSLFSLTFGNCVLFFLSFLRQEQKTFAKDLHLGCKGTSLLCLASCRK